MIFFLCPKYIINLPRMTEAVSWVGPKVEPEIRKKGI